MEADVVATNSSVPRNPSANASTLEPAAVRILSCLALLVLLLCPATVVAAPEAGAHSLTDMVGDADRVVRGTVTSASSRWADTGRFIVTDYTVDVREVLLDRNHHISRGAQTIVVTLWGGRIGDTTDLIAGMPAPSLGRDVLMFLRSGPWVDSLAGDRSGLITLNGERGARLEIGEASVALSLVHTDGGYDLAPTQGAGVAVESLLDTVRREIGRVDPASSVGDAVGVLVDRDGSEHPLPAATPEFSPILTDPSLTAEPIAPFLAEKETILIAPESASAASNLWANGESTGSRVSNEEQNRLVTAAYSVPYYASLPIIVNQFPASFSWSPVDQHQMSYWNMYADVFRVYSTPTGTYGWGNGRWDLAGWPSSADLQRVYGQSWGALVTGYTFLRLSGTRITEADICFNPAFRWTLNDEFLVLGSSDVSFRHTMLQHLGYMWGAGGSFTVLSAMNALPNWVRGTPLLYADDTAAIRRTYPAAARSIVDVAGYLFRASGARSATEVGVPTTIKAGSEFQVTNVHVENPGSLAKAVTLRFFLSAQRNTSGTGYALGSSTTAVLASGAATLPTADLRVPPQTPAGSYYLQLITAPADGSTDRMGSNNALWTTRRITVQPEATLTSIRVLRDPLKLVLEGGGFQPGAVVKIDGQAVPKTVYRSGTTLIAKGSRLAHLMPRGQAVDVRVDLPDGGTSNTLSVTR
jgi:hypothetical protein